MTVVRRGTAGLVASRSASGEPIDRLDEGWSIPIDIIAIEPQSYGAVIGDERLGGLADNKVVLSVSSAELRGVGAGEEATFDVNGVELTVVAVVEDWLVGTAEMAVTYSTGAEIGISSDRYALVTHAGSLEALVLNQHRHRRASPRRIGHLPPAADAPGEGGVGRHRRGRAGANGRSGRLQRVLEPADRSRYRESQPSQLGCSRRSDVELNSGRWANTRRG